MFNWFKKNKLDYSQVDSHQKAINLFNKGKLSKIYLMPLEFGGTELPMNSLYIPAFVKKLKKDFDSKIEKLLIDGKKISYATEPEYKGNSFIPSKLIINITGEIEFKEIINIW